MTPGTRREVLKTGYVGFALALYVATLAGCSSFLHFSDPTVESAIDKACLLQAQRMGISVADLVDVYRKACAARLGANIPTAEQAGVSRK